MNQYEAMFLFDPTFATSFENCEAEVRRLMERAEAELLFCRRWDERRLAYKIKGRKRGVYALVYFRASPTKIGPLERDAQLSEDILRLLVLRADGVTPEAMEQAVGGHAEKPADDRGTARDEKKAGPKADEKKAGDAGAAVEKPADGATATETPAAGATATETPAEGAKATETPPGEAPDDKSADKTESAVTE